MDSASALEFVRTLRNGAEATGSTAVVAIYQASQAAYDVRVSLLILSTYLGADGLRPIQVFDKVIVLYEGRQIYFGRTTEAKQFFVDLGYHCPPRQTTADFLTSLTNPIERIVVPGWEQRVPRTPDEFAAVWRASAAHTRLLQEIAEYDEENPIGGQHLDDFKVSRRAQQSKNASADSPYTLSVPMQIKLCLRRAWQREMNDMTIAVVTVVSNALIFVVLSTAFVNLPDDTSSFFSRGALIFFSILMAAFASVLEILTLYVQRPIVEKHASQYAFYHAYTEAIASMIVTLPTKIITAVVCNVILYFVTNLRRTPGAFFVFFLFSFTTTLVMSMIFRTLGAATKTLHQAMPPTALFVIVLILYAGFALPIGDMKPWFRWLGYLNPISYAFEGTYI